MNVPVTTVREVLDEAERLIIQGGFIKSEWANAFGFCLDGALLVACGGDGDKPTTFKNPLLDSARVFVERAIRATGFVDPNEPHGQTGMRYIYRFNDQPERTEAEVLAVLRAAKELVA